MDEDGALNGMWWWGVAVVDLVGLVTGWGGLWWAGLVSGCGGLVCGWAGLRWVWSVVGVGDGRGGLHV